MNPRPEIFIDILYKNTLFDIATLTIYTNSQRPRILSYELRDELSKLPKTSYTVGYVPVVIAGDFYIEEGISEENCTSLVGELLEVIQAAYLTEALSITIPERSLNCGLN